MTIVTCEPDAKTKTLMSYARLMPNGKYEYGLIIIKESDRRKDRLERKGESATFAEAEKEAYALAEKQ